MSTDFIQTKNGDFVLNDKKNEPCFISDINAFNDFYDKVIEKIREVDNNHILFLEGDDWAKNFSVFKNLGGYRQAISFHFYPGQHGYMSEKPEARIAELERKISYFTRNLYRGNT